MSFLQSLCHEVAMLSPVLFHCDAVDGNILISVLLSFSEALVVLLLLIDAAVRADTCFFTT